MTQPFNFVNLCLLVSCVIGISAGQIFFKLSAPAFPKVFSVEAILSFIFNPYFFTALLIYGCSIILWTWALARMTLSVAYPFMALAFIFVPIMSYWFLDESLSISTFIGAGLILAGIIVTTS